MPILGKPIKQTKLRCNKCGGARNVLRDRGGYRGYRSLCRDCYNADQLPKSKEYYHIFTKRGMYASQSVEVRADFEKLIRHKLGPIVHRDGSTVKEMYNNK